MGFAALATSLIPALVSGATALFGPKGKEAEVREFNPYSRGANQRMKQILDLTGPLNEEGMDYLHSILSNDPEAFAEFEAPIKEAYEQETIPAILERFRGGQSSGSSALDQTLARSGKDLSTALASQRAGLKNQALNSLQNYQQLALRPTKQAYTVGGTPGGADIAAANAGPALQSGAEGIIDFLKSKYGGAASGGTGGSGSVGGINAINAWR
jgi:hypothetical protein